MQLRRNVRDAAADSSVDAILLAIDSPGGTVSGTADLAKDVRAAGGFAAKEAERLGLVDGIQSFDQTIAELSVAKRSGAGPSMQALARRLRARGGIDFG